MHTTGEPILQAQTSMEGEQQHPRRQLHLRRSPTEPRTATRSEDLRSEGRRQHHARAIAARVSSRNPARADGSAGRPEASASCPPRTPARLVASATRLRRWSRQWMTRQGPGQRSFFSSQLCLCPCWRRCLRLRLIEERPRGPLTKQEKPRAVRPTEPRDSYASGIRIPHSSPSHEATHTWLSGSVSRQASPNARNEEKTWLYAKIHKCSGPDSHNEQTPALKVPLQMELRFHPRKYEQPPHWRTCGAMKPQVAHRRPLWQQRQRPPLQVAKQQQRWPQGGRCCNEPLAHVPTRGARTSYQSQSAGCPEREWWR
jgi:hypothetical protein